MRKKIISAILCFSIVFSGLFAVNVRPAKAWPTTATAALANLLPEGLTTGTVIADLALQISTMVKDNIANMLVIGAKYAALKAVTKITKAIIGDGGGGGDGGGVVSDWNHYLYVAPQQVALAKMNSFFTTMSRGRSSSFNYEGVGGVRNYDAYLIAQAKKTITGTIPATNLQDVAADPNQPFSSNNMKGLMSYMQAPNNVASYTLMAQSQYASELEKATTIAIKTQVNGFLPVIKNGVISQPAAMVQNAFSGLDKMGTDLIMGANYESQKFAAYTQIFAGSALSIAARSLNYAATGKNINKNNSFPFSAGYSKKNGVTVSGGGTSFSSGNVQSNCRQRCMSNGGNDTECNAECQ